MAIALLVLPIPAIAGLADFGLLSFNGNVGIQDGTTYNNGFIGGNRIGIGTGGTLGQPGTTSTSLIAAAATALTIQVGSGTTVYGDAITGGGTVGGGAGVQGVIDTSGSNSQLTNLADSISEALALAANLNARVRTQVLPGINVGNNQARSISATVAGLNVIEIPTITAGNGFQLTINGAPGDTVVLNIGSLVLGQSASINLNGLQASQVIYNIAGTVSIDINSAVLRGNILAPASDCRIGNNLAYVGAIYCGGNIQFGNTFGYFHAPLNPDPLLPGIPESSAVFLVGTGLAALGLYRRRRSRNAQLLKRPDMTPPAGETTPPK